ncbi:MAG: homoserine kinase [Planctomycetota bacterium]
MSRKFLVSAPASTSNLGPGFDTLGLAVELGLELHFELDHPAGFGVTLVGEGHDILPSDERNGVLKVAREIAGAAVDRTRWRITSNIPVARGLGSSAAARAAGLAAGYLLRDGRLPPRHAVFQRVARDENHPDNAAATVFGGFRVSGRDRMGNWETWPGIIADWQVRLLVVVPDVPVSTQQARSLLPQTYARAAAVRNLQCLSTLLSGLARGDWDAVRRGCRDQLHEPYRLPLVPGLAETLDHLRASPATGGAYLSGAGPTLMAFLLDPARAQDVGQDCVALLANHGTGATTKVIGLQSSGLLGEELVP